MDKNVGKIIVVGLVVFIGVQLVAAKITNYVNQKEIRSMMENN